MPFAPIKIALAMPLQHGNETITELVFGREMCAGDLRGIAVGVPTYDDCRAIASRMVGIPKPVLENMPWEDFSQVVGVVMDFFNNTPLTGGKE